VVPDRSSNGAAWRDAIAAAVNSPQVPATSARNQVSTLQSGVASPPGWDPFDVWLKRVKQPRDRARIR
jgi:hypothetical protein